MARDLRNCQYSLERRPEKLITEQLAQRRCDIQQLTGKRTVNKLSLTTLATEKATPPCRHRVEFVLTKQAADDYHGHNTPSRGLCDRRPQAAIGCLRSRYAEIGKCREKAAIGDFMARIIGNR